MATKQICEALSQQKSEIHELLVSSVAFITSHLLNVSNHFRPQKDSDPPNLAIMLPGCLPDISLRSQLIQAFSQHTNLRIISTSVQTLPTLAMICSFIRP